MKRMKVLFLGIGKPGFKTEVAKDLYQKSVAKVQSPRWTLVAPEELVIDPNAGEDLALEHRDADAVILQFSTFNDARFGLQVMKVLDIPVLLWCLPEPVLGGRLQLNSLTGLNATTCALHRMKRKYTYVYTLPDGEGVRDVLVWLESVDALARLKTSVIARIGEYPAGFFASDADQIRLTERFGLRVDRLELEDLLSRGRGVPDQEVADFVALETKKISGVEKLNPEQVHKSSKITLALKRLCQEKKYDALAIRCWPEFVRDYGAVVCHSISHISDLGIPSACESDILGSATMLLENYLSGGAGTFLGDLVHADAARNTAVFWHCGFGPLKLASKLTGPVAGVQPNRGIGLALNNSLRGGRVTIARISQTQDDYRLLVMTGEALDVPNPFEGVSAEIKFRGPVKEMMDKVLYDGYEFHYAVVWADVSAHLRAIGRILGIPVDFFE